MSKAPDFRQERILWKRGFRFVAGLDEVGRGAWAGPIVASAVALTPQISNFQFPISNEIIIDDSKKLKPKERERAAKWIKENAVGWGIGEVGPSLINRIGMARATKMAFRRAIADASLKLKIKNLKLDFLLIDAFYIPFVRGLPVGKNARKGRRFADSRARQKAIIDGDQKSLSISAASILAKVYRDSLMRKLSLKYNLYCWGRNKGYGTREHQEAIKKYGITRLHRKRFVETWQSKLKVKSEKLKITV